MNGQPPIVSIDFDFYFLIFWKLMLCCVYTYFRAVCQLEYLAKGCSRSVSVLISVSLNGKGCGLFSKASVIRSTAICSLDIY